MKNLLYILLLIPFGILAQTPKGFNYQAVIRNAAGNLITTQQVSIKISLLNGSATGFSEYVEQHDIATNGYGVASIVIGEGMPISGTYDSLSWSSVDYYLKTELDIQGNGNFLLMGTTELVAVPYAVHAESANFSVNDGDTSSTNELQQLSLQGNQLILSNGGAVNLTTTVDLDPDPSNELQVLSISGDTLHLSQGNFIVLPPDGDNNPTNEIQSLSNTAGTISLSNSNSITLEDSSAVNELQTLSNTAGTISISSGNTITLVDSSATNELQTLSQTAGTISISSGNTIVVVDSSATNELQSLSVVGTDSLKISEGNTIKIPTGPPNLDNSSTNELQTLSVNHQGNSISISNGNTVSLPFDGDNSSTNELQSLSVNHQGNSISISNGNTVNLPFDGDKSSSNELQQLTFQNDTLSISSGNSVVIDQNFDWLFPDGKKGFEPILNVGNNYSPPAGKRLYITRLYSRANWKFSINNYDIFYGKSNYYDYGQIINPLILDDNDVFKKTSSSTTDMSASGFLIDENTDYDAITFALISSHYSQASGVYTVPTGKKLVILNLYSSNDYINLTPNNMTNQIQIALGSNRMNNVSSNITNQPIFLDEGDKIWGYGTFNGYLMDK